jgi:hypothetical protein
LGLLEEQAKEKNSREAATKRLIFSIFVSPTIV